MNSSSLLKEQRERASGVDLVEFLRFHGEKLLRSGRDYRLSSNHSMMVRGNEWYDHGDKVGGGPISFVQNYLNKSDEDAIAILLGGEQGQASYPAAEIKSQERQPFVLPPHHGEMRRLYAYMLHHRYISRDVLNLFTHAGTLYESAEPSKDGKRVYHNAVFVGTDAAGIPRHAHKRSISTYGKSYKLTVAGSDGACCFRYMGPGDRLYVFEAPVDMLSFLTLHPKGWEKYSYVCLCGVGEQSMLTALSAVPRITKVGICLDHDEAGIQNGQKLRDMAEEMGYTAKIFLPTFKDWNEDLKFLHGVEPIPAEEHLQQQLCDDLCAQLVPQLYDMRTAEASPRTLKSLTNRALLLINQGKTTEALDKLQKLSATALLAAAIHYRQMEQPVSRQWLVDRLWTGFHPYQNNSKAITRTRELQQQMAQVEQQQDFYTEDKKRKLAEVHEKLALAAAKLHIRLEYDTMKQQLRQERQREQEAQVSETEPEPLDILSMAM